jgi:hypothetical protein
VRSRSFLTVFVALLSLTTFAFAQSVYQAVAGNREFIVLNQVSHADLLLIILCFNVLPALVLAVVWIGARNFLGQRAANWFLSAAFLLLLLPFLFELHKTYVSPLVLFPHNTILLLIPIAIAAVVVFRYREAFERFLMVLSPVILLFPALFLWRSWNGVALPANTIAQRSSFTGETGNHSYPPIFILLLDEFTRPALLDAGGNIDSARFPHFAQFAQQSTWFTDATANAEYTTRSIPVIVTGNFPHGNDASDQAYPDNLFRLLAPSYDVTIHEEVTRFCANPAYHCPDAERVRQRGHLLRAVMDLYLLRVAPKSVVVALEVRDLQQEQQRFREFLSEIAAAPNGKPQLEFMHLQLPHAPYMLNPDGSVHPESPAGFDPKFAGNVALLARLRGDYEKQIEFVDSELGAFLDKLKQAGLYDQSLIIVTSDHGVSWNTAAPGRTLSDANADMIFPVPLFIKLPGQKDGKVSNEDVQLIDILPTIAAVAGVRVPWTVAGRDAFAANYPSRQKIMIDASGRTFAYPDTFAETTPKE